MNSEDHPRLMRKVAALAVVVSLAVVGLAVGGLYVADWLADRMEVADE